MSDKIIAQALNDVVKALRLNSCPTEQVAAAVADLRYQMDRKQRDYHYLHRKYEALRRLSTPSTLDQAAKEAACSEYTSRNVEVVEPYHDENIRPMSFEEKRHYLQQQANAQRGDYPNFGGSNE